MKKVLATQNFDQQYAQYAGLSVEEVYQQFQTTAKGLGKKEVEKRLLETGRNVIVDKKHRSGFSFLFRSFCDPFILVLLVLGTVSIFLNDRLGGCIIYVLAVISAMIRFIQEYRSYRTDVALSAMVHTTTSVHRGMNRVKEIPMEDLVVGDVVELNAGAIVPADIRIVTCRDLFVSQSTLTGEAIPVEKYMMSQKKTTSCIEQDTICFMGTSVVSGSASAVVIATGKNTYLGQMAKKNDKQVEPTNFEVGMKQVTKTLIRYMIVIVLAVFFINSILKHNVVEALFFSISVAVGITPGMLPMIVNVNLSKGVRALSKKKTIVKNLASIQNLGAVDTFCTDKTGTLTMDKIIVQRYMNVNGEDDLSILESAYLNSSYSTGIKNLIDRAVVSFGTEHGLKESLNHYQKVDEIPFDYVRKRMSVVVKTKERTHRLITKGALEEILKVCSKVRYHNRVVDLTPEMKKKVHANADQLLRTGMQVIALAEKKEYPGIQVFNPSHERDMTFIGYVAFLDPPKKDVSTTLKDLAKLGIVTKILTGDSAETTKTICEQVGFEVTGILTGHQLQRMTDDVLLQKLDITNVYAKLTPLQKQRVIRLLREQGHVVGYMGDGVNDAPSLREADVGISVDHAADIAKESSDILLLEKSLRVLKEGILEGRKVYGNIMKYMKMALASNFGNVFSVLFASICLPFLPMIPIQILIQNLIYDFTQIAIPFDEVDPEFLAVPRKWDTHDLGIFMNTMGIASSIIDVLTFGVLWFIMGYCSTYVQEFFQTGWFIESLISQILIVHLIRTAKKPFLESRPSKALLFASLIGIGLAVGLPYLLQGVESFHFVVLPPIYYLYVVVIIGAYAILTQLVKEWYIHRYHRWL